MTTFKIDVPDSGQDPLRGPGFLIDEFWAYVGVDGTGAEGVIAIQGIIGGIPMLFPLVFSDARFLTNNHIRDEAIKAARKDRKTVRLIKVSSREVIETVYQPSGGPR